MLKPAKLEKVLIANRGEIALRIIRALQELGVASVAVYAQDDAQAPHVAAADVAVPLQALRPARAMSRLAARAVVRNCMRCLLFA